MLKKTTYFLLLLFLIADATSLFAQQVSMQEAATIAKEVYVQNVTTASRNVQNTRILSQYTHFEGKQESYYIFNLQPTGFVIVAADDRYNPILAFSEESHINFDNDQANIGLFGTLSKHEQRITHIRKNNLTAGPAIQREWKSLRAGTHARSFQMNVVVPPLTTTKWNQGEFYNAECPTNAEVAAVGPAGRTYCGCTPIAMSQLIKYHNYPAQGNGTIQYQDPTFGQLTGDFCNTTYDWGNMPDELTGPNQDVAELIYQIGASVQTEYSPSYTLTYFSYVRDAYVNYFGYDEAANWFLDSDYSQFATVAIQDLDRNLPLLLTGSTLDRSVGHTWVTDGYGVFFGTNDTYFHFNWGWGGDNNGWFLDGGESWEPLGGQGDDVFEITYYWDRYILHNLFPAGQACPTPNDDVYAAGMQDIYARLYNSTQLLKGQEISFRYRVAGTNNWINTDVTTSNNELLSGLIPGTTYEFQGRRKCCSLDWSAYSEIQTFSTTGARVSPDPISGCDAVSAADLYTTTITDNNAYIYTPTPYGAVNNQFRYRLVGSTDWTESHISTSYYRYLINLVAGSQYEFQVRHECSAGEWSGYSAAQSFTTTGGMETCAAIFFADADGDGFGDANNGVSGCAAPAGYVNNADDCDDANPNIPTAPGSACSGGVIANDGCTCNPTSGGGNPCSPVSGNLTITSITNTNAYIYTPQPNGAVNNQFRYRAVGSSTWIYTDISSIYYRYLSNLSPGTVYEFQASEACGDGSYSDYTASFTFMTTGQAQTGDNGDDGSNGDDGNNGNGNGNNGNGNGNNGNGNGNNGNGNGNNGNGNGNNGNGNGNNGNGNGNNGNGGDGNTNCSVVDGQALYTSSTSSSATYVYTPQPLGAINNQFRHRAVGTSAWVYSDISTTYYRYLTGLVAATGYEVQVSQECISSVWSEFSSTMTFYTTSNFQAGDKSLAPLSYSAFQQLTTEELQVGLAPNPAAHEITFSLPSGFQSKASLVIYNTQGKVVKEVALSAGQYQESLNITELNAGIYMLQYRAADTLKTIKFVKK